MYGRCVELEYAIKKGDFKIPLKKNLSTRHVLAQKFFEKRGYRAGRAMCFSANKL